MDDQGALYCNVEKQFPLARFGYSLVVLYCNVENCSTKLWLSEDVDDFDDAAPH
jgi:predicted site-specific integrase-resolvase